MRLRSKRFFMRAAARLLFRRENRLYQQTESTDANLCSFCVREISASCLSAAATAFAPCTEWPRTVMRGGLRKVNSGPDSVPKANRRTEPSPRFSRFAARPQGVAAQRRVWGSQEGAREPYGALAPFCLRRQTAAMPGLPIGSHFSPAAASRRNGGTASPVLRGKHKLPLLPEGSIFFIPRRDFPPCGSPHRPR